MCRRQLVVEDDHVRVERDRGVDDLLRFPLAEVGRRVRAISLLRKTVEGIGTGGVGEGLQLVEGEAGFL